MAVAGQQMRLPKPFSLKDDFRLWIRRFESYCRVAKITKDVMPDMLLSLLDDSAFRAYDLLGLAAEVTSNYDQLLRELQGRFNPCAGEAELRFQLGQRQQQPSETLDEICDALIHLANRAYPDLDVDVRMNLVRDRFIAGVKAEYIQDRLLEMAPKSLDSALEIAKRLEAARSARKQMQMASGTRVFNLQSDETERITTTTLDVKTAPSSSDIVEVLRKNTETLGRLADQISKLHLEPAEIQPTRRRSRSQICWKCGESGHLMRNCPSGNEKRSVKRVNHRPVNY